MIKAVSLLLVFFAVLALFGRLRLPRPRLKRPSSARCKACGRPRIGKGPCPCGEGA